MDNQKSFEFYISQPGSFLLWLLNINISSAGLYKKHYYDFKDKFLRENAIKDGCDLQKLQKTCWSCGGAGDQLIQHEQGEEWIYCNPCGGCGYYSETQVILQRYKYGEYSFHVPLFARTIRNYDSAVFCELTDEQFKKIKEMCAIRNEITGLIANNPKEDNKINEDMFRQIFEYLARTCKYKIPEGLDLVLSD